MQHDHPAGARHSGLRPKRRGAAAGEPRTRIALAAILGIVLFVVSVAAFGLMRLQGNVRVDNVDVLLGDRPSSGPPLDANAGNPINLLLIGSDARVGKFAKNSSIEGMRSDATLLVHISADRKRVDAVSIPRDLRVDVPSCNLRDGTTTKAGNQVKFNEAFARGGDKGDVSEAAACTIKTVEQITGVYIDDYVVVDFEGFEGMVEALGGVPLYFPEDVADKRAGLYIDKGCRLLDGHDALGAARARYTLGDGSDISRIGRQQQLMSSVVREALNLNLLTDLPSLYSFLDAATKSLSTGPQIGSLSTMAGLAYSLRGIKPDEVTFATVPLAWEGWDIYLKDDAKYIWDRINADEPLTEPKESASPEDNASDSASPSESSEPEPSTTEAPAPTLDQSTTAERDDETPKCTRENALPNE